ncbi:MAG: MBL fold metallo-hydrolase [Victivallales bacterium]|jgi:phosphoribosyl 1,2-cyclic phosphodiesterase|nr:MBL fold metallo-hydrolase [Victivallales bacterium]
MVKLSVLGSGSRGNALVIAGDEGAIIVDMGFSRRELLKRLEQLGIDPGILRVALLTHEHDDHSKGCRVFCNDLRIPLCTTSPTAAYLRRRDKLPDQVFEFEPGCDFQFAGFEISPFAVQHDAASPVGFVIRRGNCTIGIATDLGDVNALAKQRLCDCNALIIESNYDAKMLRDSDRQLYLKQRILGRHGHLDNMVALEVIGELLTARTSVLMLAHLSRECNNPELVRSLFERKLSQLGRSDLRFEVLRQEQTLGPVELDDNFSETEVAYAAN